MTTITNGSQTFTADQLVIAREYARVGDQAATSRKVARSEREAGRFGIAELCQRDAQAADIYRADMRSRHAFLNDMREAAMHLGYADLNEYLDDLEAHPANRRPALPEARRLFSIVAVAHQDCPKCEDCARSAGIMASVTGSVGSSYAHHSTEADGRVEHSAKVTRLSVLLESAAV